MQQRMAGSMAVLAFAICLLIGGLQADNTFTTTVSRALVAMAGTFVVGLILGAVARKMLDENLNDEVKKLKNNEAKTATEDR
ncbi:MAG: hypothetical protein IT447_03040 [Phycisphaerales bacterium]|jgi:NhaP-type Na+/H+ or K+/H+ antiporter|nr:hypothetical protein [Phycisphaerales bacterium]